MRRVIELGVTQLDVGVAVKPLIGAHGMFPEKRAGFTCPYQSDRNGSSIRRRGFSSEGAINDFGRTIVRLRQSDAKCVSHKSFALAFQPLTAQEKDGILNAEKVLAAKGSFLVERTRVSP